MNTFIFLLNCFGEINHSDSHIPIDDRIHGGFNPGNMANGKRHLVMLKTSTNVVNTGAAYCTGSLLSGNDGNDYVLTAKHCVDGGGWSNLVFHMCGQRHPCGPCGIFGCECCNYGVNCENVRYPNEVYTYPNDYYDEAFVSADSGGVDIAIVKLNGGSTSCGGGSVEYATIASTNPSSGATLTHLGYGRDGESAGQGSVGYLNQLDVAGGWYYYTTYTSWQYSSAATFIVNMVGGNDGSGIRPGDSGGPLMSGSSVIGVHSFVGSTDDGYVQSGSVSVTDPCIRAWIMRILTGSSLCSPPPPPHSHNPHAHDPHAHDPHAHYPHAHYPHAHYPHAHSPPPPLLPPPSSPPLSPPLPPSLPPSPPFVPMMPFTCGTGGEDTDNPSTDGIDYCVDNSQCPCGTCCYCTCTCYVDFGQCDRLPFIYNGKYKTTQYNTYYVTSNSISYDTPREGSVIIELNSQEEPTNNMVFYHSIFSGLYFPDYVFKTNYHYIISIN